MKRKPYTDEQISFVLWQAELGTSVEEICRRLGISNSAQTALTRA
jgi:putative transposase